jgi:hypothetical protein
MVLNGREVGCVFKVSQDYVDYHGDNTLTCKRNGCAGHENDDSDDGDDTSARGLTSVQH